MNRTLTDLITALHEELSTALAAITSLRQRAVHAERERDHARAELAAIAAAEREVVARSDLAWRLIEDLRGSPAAPADPAAAAAPASSWGAPFDAPAPDRVPVVAHCRRRPAPAQAFAVAVTVAAADQDECEIPF